TAPSATLTSVLLVKQILINLAGFGTTTLRR
ncbi:unnamed protein product, partial [Allacma fusca]